MSRRLLVLAIDAANADLVERWAGDGSLPTIARLMSTGITGRIRGLEGFFVGSTWPSLYTGLSPAQHGHHSLVQLEPGTYRYYRCADGELLHGTPFWDRISAAGRRVAVLDVPLSRLSADLNGIQTVEWGSHDALFGFRARPASLARSIHRRFGTHPLGPTCDGTGRGPREYAALVDRLARGVRSKGRLTERLLGDHAWDFAIQVFTEGHCAGHQCWHLHDPDHPAHDADTAAAVGDPLLRVYREIDSAIERVLRNHGDDPVVVMSAHGMSYWYGAQFLLPDVLTKLGVARARMPAQPAASGGMTLNLARAGWHLLPGHLRHQIRSTVERLRPAGLPDLPVDARNSLCFPVNNGLAVGGIRLNLKGREPNGLIAPGPEAVAFCDRLTTDLLEICDERTGLPAIRAVRRVNTLYQGERLHALPDLLVEWSDAVPTGSASLTGGIAATVRLTSPKIGTVEGTNSYGRSGEHRPEGFFIASIPGAGPQRLTQAVSLLDLAPTFCEMLEVPPGNVEGRPIQALLEGLAGRKTVGSATV